MIVLTSNRLFHIPLLKTLIFFIVDIFSKFLKQLYKKNVILHHSIMIIILGKV